MTSFMINEHVILCELSTALFTDKGFLSSVDSHMCFKGRRLGKLGVTLVTFKRFIPRMRSLVEPQSRFGA